MKYRAKVSVDVYGKRTDWTGEPRDNMNAASVDAIELFGAFALNGHAAEILALEIVSDMPQECNARGGA